MMDARIGFPFLSVSLLAAVLAVSCASTGSLGDEYFSIASAYFELGKYTQSEPWFDKAKKYQKNRPAAVYNLGRIYFETGRYGESVRAFDELLRLDPENILALKSAAFARIKLGTEESLREAADLYGKVVALVPDSPDASYNYALVLHALKDYARAESVLLDDPALDLEPGDELLLLARTQKALGKVECIDSYGRWLDEWDDPRVMAEYAEACESVGYFARAAEAYGMVFDSIKAGDKNAADLNLKGRLRFRKSRALLASGDKQGLEVLSAAVSEGFDDPLQLDELMGDGRLSGELAAEVGKIATALKESLSKKVEEKLGSP